MYRMTKEERHIIHIEPDESVLLGYLRETASEEEMLQVEEWLQEDGEHEKKLLQIACIEHAFRTQERIISRDPIAAYSKVKKQIRKARYINWMNRACIVAACFVGVLILSTVLANWMQKAIDKPVQMITVQANAGMRTHFNLPDGTVAYLNSGTILTYPFPYDKKERRITLSGEAYFKVVSNPLQPFVVSVANDRMRVRVLGTEFNLQAYEGDNIVQTTLVKGLVNLEAEMGNGGIHTKALQPSEKAVFDLCTHSISINEVDVESEIAWKEGRLVFKDLSLPEVLKKLSYFYNVKFQVLDPIITTYRFTGTFHNRQLSQILEYLRISSQINYEIRQMKGDDSLVIQQELVILSKRKK